MSTVWVVVRYTLGGCSDVTGVYTTAEAAIRAVDVFEHPKSETARAKANAQWRHPYPLSDIWARGRWEVLPYEVHGEVGG